jgi:hypothetical protein
LGSGPSWLTKTENGFAPRPEVVATLTRALEMAAAGTGAHSIALTLNNEGIPHPEGCAWSKASMARLLKDRRLLGWWQPERQGKPIGEPRKAYPEVIDPALFARVQAMLSTRQRATGRKGAEVSNLLTGAVRCGACGGVMTVMTSAKSRRYLRCDRALTKGCNHRTSYRLDKLEEYLPNVVAVSPPDLAAPDTDEAARALAEIDAEIAEITAARDILRPKIATSPTRLADYEALADRLDALAEKRKPLAKAAEIARLLPDRMSRNIEAAREIMAKAISLPAGDPGRSTARDQARAAWMATGIKATFAGGVVEFTWPGGQVALKVTTVAAGKPGPDITS